MAPCRFGFISNSELNIRVCLWRQSLGPGMGLANGVDEKRN